MRFVGIQTIATVVTTWFAFASAACSRSVPEPAPGSPPASTDIADSANVADVPQADPAGEGPVAKAAVDAALAEFASEAWYGVYFAGRKVGHVHAWRKREENPKYPEAPWLVAYDLSMRFQAGAGGPSNELRGGERRWYAANWPHALMATSFEQKGMQFDENRHARRDGGDFVIERRLTGGGVDTKRQPATAENLGTQLVVMAPRAAMWGQTKVLKVPSWNWERQTDELVTATLAGTREVQRGGIPQTLLEVDILWPSIGMPARSIVAPDGLALESTLGPALVMKLEERDVATSGISGLDIVSTAVKSPMALGNPGRHQRLVYRLKLKAELAFPDDAGQRVRREDGGELVITRDVTLGEPLKPGDAEQYLLPDAMMDAAEPSIVAEAKRLTEKATLPAEKAASIAQFVYQSLVKKLATHLPAASVILAQKVGDCTEHTWLAVALLRAAGVPARPVYGVAYTGDIEQVFGYHAWVEVAINGHWMAIDPTWGQPLADATHLKFGHDAGAVAPFFDALQLQSIELAPQ
jgi:hypothetical protein